MNSELPLFPIQASSVAPSVDHLLYFLLAVAAFFSVGIFLTIFYFAIRYRRRSDAELPHPIHGVLSLEILWSVIPFGLTMVMFIWGASVFFKLSDPPADAQNIYVVAKRWMWKLQHMEGQREINELHIPVGQAVKLTMTSEDVIHSFYVPAFRTKADVLPGRYTTTWFKPTKPGKYHLFCAEYCGTKHSGMIGWIYAMEPQDYQAWLSGGAQGSLASTGEKLFEDLACANCHHLKDQGRCPNLTNLFGSQVLLSDGSKVTADEDYIRESILNPSAKIVSGYQPIMPTFQGQVTEEGVLQLVEYIKSLTPKPGAQPAAGAAATKAINGPHNNANPPTGANSVPTKR
ncbi:MAG: cytochrome c oxidase subunit II [Bryobacteraceae bacterium]